ncbi:MAG TPA: PDZ domain-containing protein, partial [Thermoguttaceae bacterium]
IKPANLLPQEVLSGMHGIRVAQVVPGTPAVKAGLKTDDIIITVDDAPIHDADSLVLNIGKLPVEAVVHLSLIRNGNPLTVDIELTKYPVRGKKIVTVPEPLWRGMRVDYPTAMPETESRTVGEKSFSGEGLVVAEVAENSPAASAGLQPGMIITHVGHAAVNTPKEFRAAVDFTTGAVELHIADDIQRPIRTVDSAQ